MHNIGNGNRTVVYDGKIAGLYDLEETLGSGHFAVVKLARHVFTGEKVAVKVIDKTKLDEVSRAHLFQEVRCMKLVQHPNVVRLYEVIDTQTKLYLILELGDGGDLYDYIMKHEGGLSENLAREYFRQIVRAISYCHQLHVVHRDLKPENVVFFEKLGVVKLTDFGFSNKFCPGQKLETSCGSLAYSAPEILLGDSYDAPAVDIWSLGVILYMLVCGQPPFEKANDSETLTMIMDCKYTMPSHVSIGCRRLISMMLVREPEKRATLSQIASDPWLTQDTSSSSSSGGNNSSNIDDGVGQKLQQQQQQQDSIPEYLPLVSRQQVSDDDHTLIINKMVSGNIATKEEILDALDRNEYNHITATYFLLAERKLRQKRQEQLQKRRPELSLPVTTSSRITPRTRIQGTNRDMKPIGGGDNTSNHLLVPTNSQLCTPRTPGAETTGGRSRKCSIVQEEDDEDEIAGCTNRDELTTPLNRRGSRSEGRINIAIQDRVECERLKKEKEANIPSTTTVGNTTTTAVTNKMTALAGRNQNQSKGLENISGIKIINKDTNNVRLRLGVAGGNRISLDIEKRFEKNLKIPESVSSADNTATTTTKIETGKRKSSIPDNLKSEGRYNRETDVIQTKVLTDSSTIQIPITMMSTSSIQGSNIIPKYKTMPSPTRPTIVLSGSGTRELNEIFEEGTDIGSSDTSTTTTPRPITRNTHFTSRSSAATPQRKSKFHKTRTPSCSSSDASDDDSESRKKRAHKMTDVSKPLQPQRRDSHDDSSDSQDQGNAPSSGGGANNTSSYLVCSTTSANQNNSGDRTTQNGSTSSTSNTQNSTTNSIGDSEKRKICEKTEQQQPIATTTHFRRHRAGRRRAGETRLRESQSLNRITEVQETTELTVAPSTMPMNSSLLSNHTTTANHSNSHNRSNNTIIKNSNQNHNNNNNNNNIHKINNNYVNNYMNGGITSNNSVLPPTTTNAETVTPPVAIPAPVTTPTIISKPKGLSARLFQGFIRKNDFIQQMPPSANAEDKLLLEKSDNVDNNVIANGVDFAKGIRVTATCDSGGGSDINGISVGGTTPTTKTSSTTKKLKMLGRYFQVACAAHNNNRY